MELKELSDRLQKRIESYAREYEIERSADWCAMKIQEELGELVDAHLRLTGRKRLKNKTVDDVRENLGEEIADVIAMTVLFARYYKIDLDSAFRKKWFKESSRSENRR